MANSTDVLFRIGLIVKGVDSLFEMAGGVLLAMPTKLARWLAVLSQHELLRHHEAMSGRLDHLADTVTTHVSTGKAAYLIVHGLAKVVLITAIFYKKRWGYVGLISILSLFSATEIVRAVLAKEVVTGLLAVFDLFVVFLIAKEYKMRYGNPERPK